MLRAACSGVKTAQCQLGALVIGYAGSFSKWPHVRLGMEEKEINCPYLIGGKTPSNPLSPREAKTRHSNSSWWLLTTSGLRKEGSTFLT